MRQELRSPRSSEQIANEMFSVVALRLENVKTLSYRGRAANAVAEWYSMQTKSGSTSRFAVNLQNDES